MAKISKNWIKLFSNISTESELDLLLKEITSDGLEGWKQKYLEYESNGKQQIFQKLNKLDWGGYVLKSDIQNSVHWLNLFKPICCQYINMFEKFLQLKTCVTDRKQILKEIESYFFQLCMDMSYRVVVLEINDLRRSSRLVGNSSEERYQYYVNKLTADKDYVIEFYERYPVLYEMLEKKIDNTCKYVMEIIDNFENESKYIENSFNFKDFNLSKISFNAGDTHSKGKSVCILHLTNNQRLVYKPRNMLLDVRLESFIKDFEVTFGLESLLYIPKVLIKGDHSYVEFIDTEDCSSNSEVRQYFKNIGILLAFLYIFGSKDYHGENILAKGPYPYLIDNETILHFDEERNISSSIDNMYNFIANSVYSTGILPMTLYSVNNDKGMEIGTLNSGEKRVSPFLSHQLVNVGTDKIRIEKVFKEVGDFPSTVKYKGKTVSCANYRENVLDGFELIYQIVRTNKEKVFNMFNYYFKSCETRYIHRNTNIYVQFLETSRHPELLRNKIDFEMYLLRLCEYTNMNEIFDRKMVFDEIRQLREGDIPLFYADSFNNSILSDNYSYLHSFTDHSISDKVQSKLSNLSYDDLLRQKRIINMCFMGTELFVKDNRHSYKKNYVNMEEMFVKRIVSSAFKYEDDVTWLTMLAMNKNFDFAPMDFSLYSGTAGVILGIDSLHNKELSSLLPGVSTYTQCYIETLNNDIPVQKLGAFTGIYGYLYMLCVLEQEGRPLLENSQEFIINILKLTSSSIEEMNNLDIIGGISGILGVLLKIKSVFGIHLQISNLVEKMSESIVHKLLNKYRDQGFWMYNDAGYAHGNYGVIAQLFKFAKSSNSDLGNQVISCIKGYLENERLIFSKTGDIGLRKNAKYYSWCNGVVGIVQVKNYLLQNHFSDQYLKDEVQNYVREILNSKITIDNSICHGNIGNLVILSTILGEDKLLLSKIQNDSKTYLLDKISNESDDWGVLTGELGILMANYKCGRKRLNDLLLLN